MKTCYKKIRARESNMKRQQQKGNATSSKCNIKKCNMKRVENEKVQHGYNKT